YLRRGAHLALHSLPTRRSSDLRMFFDVSKGAFRAGAESGTRWDDANIGQYSTALGGTLTASGNSSTAIGWNSGATGNYSTAIGRSEEHTSELQSRENLVCRLLL